jgi:hypothetical protein
MKPYSDSDDRRARCHRNPCQPPTCVPCIQVFSRANNRSQALDLYRSGRFLHKINNLAASAACGEVVKNLRTFPLGQYLLNESAQAFRVGMKIGLGH